MDHNQSYRVEEKKEEEATSDRHLQEDEVDNQQKRQTRVGDELPLLHLHFKSGNHLHCCRWLWWQRGRR